MLRTARLLLRDLAMDDCTALNEIECHPIVTRYMSYDPQTPDDTRKYLVAALEEQSAVPRLTFDLAITLLDQPVPVPPWAPHTLIGRCGLGIRRPEHREAMVWYELHPAAWGHGFAVEAVGALLDFGFCKLGLHRIWADCDPRNASSCRVAQRLGMTLEGHLRENYFLKGEWCSTAVYSLLEQEWMCPIDE